MSMDLQERMEALVEHGYALIEQSRIDLATHDWYAELPVQIIDHYYMRGDRRLMPVLLRIDEDAPWLETLARDLEEDDPLISCLLKSPTDRAGEDALMTQLLNRVVVYVPPGSSRILLRFYSPLVFPQLLNIVRPRQIVSLLGPIEAISFPFQGELITHTHPELPPGELIPVFWTLTVDQLRRLDRGEYLFKVMTWYEWEFHLKRWPSYDDWATTLRRAEQAMEYALSQYALHGLSDQQAFARHTLRYGEHFHLHPRMQDLIDALPLRAEAPGGRRGYRDAVFALSEADWAAIAAPLY